MADKCSTSASPAVCKPRCSVVIPCFNALTTIAPTLLSACRQTIEDIEIIVVDDGSTDKGPGVIAAIATADARVRLIRQANKGVSAARNAGITAAKSRVIALLDADDRWARDHLESHLKRLAADKRLGVSFSAARFVDTKGSVVGQSRAKLSNPTPADLLASNPTTTCSTLVIRRDVFKDVGMFRTDMRHNEDQEWLFRVTLSGWTMTGDANARVDYRTSPGGLASDLDGMFVGFQTMLREARKLAPTLVERNEARATANMMRYLARRAISLGLPPKIARGWILAALKLRPTLALSEPRATLPTLIAAMVPPVLLLPVLHRVRPHLIHA